MPQLLWPNSAGQGTAGQLIEEGDGKIVPHGPGAGQLLGAGLELQAATLQKLELLLQAAHQTLLAAAADVTDHLPGAAT
jgi:hypothetical protein